MTALENILIHDGLINEGTKIQKATYTGRPTNCSKEHSLKSLSKLYQKSENKTKNKCNTIAELLTNKIIVF